MGRAYAYSVRKDRPPRAMRLSDIALSVLAVIGADRSFCTARDSSQGFSARRCLTHSAAAERPVGFRGVRALSEHHHGRETLSRHRNPGPEGQRRILSG